MKVPSWPGNPHLVYKKSGGGGPHAVNASIAPKDPGGPGGGGGGQALRRKLEWAKKAKGFELDADSLMVGAGELSPLTLQAAAMQLNTNSGVLNSSALKKLLSWHGTCMIGDAPVDELTPAWPFTGFEIPEDLLLATEAEEIHFRELITDPRAGFAPEGLEAFDLECAEHLQLTPLIAGPGDFSEVGGARRWSVVVLSGEDSSFDDLQRAASLKTNLLLSTPLNSASALLNGIRNLGKHFPTGHIHIAMRARG